MMTFKRFLTPKYFSASVVAMFFLCLNYNLTAQPQQQVAATLDTNVIRIGEQTMLRLSSAFNKNNKYNWFALPDTFNNIEIISRDTVDTIQVNNAWQLQQNILITSFDSGNWVIPPAQLSFNLPGDTTTYFSSTSPLLIMVNGIAVDTTKAAYDIKSVIDVPFSIMDYIWWIVGAILILAIIAGTIFFLRKSKIEQGAPQIVKIKKPAHEIALAALANLKEEKLWQQGQVKEYHTNLTDIIRTYIGNRYNIHTLELTTDEIMQYQIIKSLPADVNLELKNLLQLADLVKFAKANPLANEHELSYSSAFDFVMKTKQSEQTTVIKTEQNNSMQK